MQDGVQRHGAVDRYLIIGKGEQLEDAGSAGQRLGDELQGLELVAAGQDKMAALIVLVDKGPLIQNDNNQMIFAKGGII